MVYVRHVNHGRSWRRLGFVDKRILYSHRRDIRRDKIPRSVRLCNRGMPIRVFDDKCKFHELMRGSAYYPPDPRPGELAIVKKALSCHGQGHYVLRVPVDEDRPRPPNWCVQSLVPPLLLDGHKFTLRVLVGFSRSRLVMPYERALVLVCRAPYKAACMAAELTNNHANGDNVRTFACVWKALCDMGVEGVFARHMDALRADLQARFGSQCPDKPGHFDVHGVDILLREDATPIVLETNPYWYSGDAGGFDDKLAMFRSIVAAFAQDMDDVDALES